MTNAIHTLILVLYLMYTSNQVEIELRNATFPTPREATIFYELRPMTSGTANFTLREILEKNPLLKHLDMFKDEGVTEPYSTKQDPSWDKEPLVVFGRSPKHRKKLDPGRWHLTQRSRSFRTHGVKNFDLNADKTEKLTQPDELYAPASKKQAIYDNFGEDYQKFNTSEFHKGTIEVTDANHAYPPLPTFPSLSTKKPVVDGVTFFTSSGPKTIKPVTHGVSTFSTGSNSPTTSNTTLNLTSDPYTTSFFYSTLPYISSNPPETTEIITTQFPMTYEEKSDMTSSEYKLFTAPAKILGSTKVTEGAAEASRRVLGDENMIQKMLGDENYEEEGPQEELNETKVENSSEGSSFRQALDLEMTTMPFEVTEKLMTMLSPSSTTTTTHPPTVFQQFSELPTPKIPSEVIKTSTFNPSADTPGGLPPSIPDSRPNSGHFSRDLEHSNQILDSFPSPGSIPTLDPLDYGSTFEPEEVEPSNESIYSSSEESYALENGIQRLEEVDPMGSREKELFENGAYATKIENSSQDKLEKWENTSQNQEKFLTDIIKTLENPSESTNSSNFVDIQTTTPYEDLEYDPNDSRIEEIEPEMEKNSLENSYDTKFREPDRPYDTKWLDRSTSGVAKTTLAPIFIRKRIKSGGTTTLEPSKEGRWIEKPMEEGKMYRTTMSSSHDPKSVLLSTHIPGIRPTDVPSHPIPLPEDFFSANSENMTPDEIKNAEIAFKNLIEGGKRELRPVTNQELEETLENMNLVREEEVFEEDGNQGPPREYYLTPQEVTEPSSKQLDSTPYFTDQLLPQFGTLYPGHDMANAKAQLGSPSYSYSGGNNGPKGPKFVDQKVSYGEFGRVRPKSLVVFDPNVAEGRYDTDQSTKLRIISHSSFNPPSGSRLIKLNSRFPSDNKASKPTKTTKKGYLKSLSEVQEIHKHNPIRKPNYAVLQGQKLLTGRNLSLPLTTTQATLSNPVMNPYWRTNPASIIHFPVFRPLNKAIAVAVQAHGIPNLEELMEPDKPSIQPDPSGHPLKYGPPRAKKPETLSGLQPLSEKEILKRLNGQLTHEGEVKSDYDNLDLLPREQFDEAIARCFIVVNNCLIANVSPMERKITMNRSECIEFCVNTPTCLSLTYAESMSICDLYNVKNGSDHTMVLKFLGYTYYEPKIHPVSSCLFNKTSRDSLVPNSFPVLPGDALNSVISNLLSQPVIVTSDDTEELRELEQLKTTAIFLTTTQKTTTERIPWTSTIERLPMTIQNEVAASDYEKEEDQHDAFCPEDKDIGLFKTQGYRLRNFAIDGYKQNSSESECVFSCFINLAEGDNPYECVSSTYNHRRKECTLHPQGANIQGNGHLEMDQAYTQYEKTCILSSIVDRCKGFPIIRQPQKTLVGYTKSANTASNLVDCLELCYMKYMADQSCKSVMYFYEESVHNCLLNSESQRTQPDFYIDEVEVIVDYASFEECFDILRNPDLYEPSIQVSDDSDEPYNPLKVRPIDTTLRVDPAITVRPYEKSKKSKKLQKIDNDASLSEDFDPSRDSYNQFKVDSEEGISSIDDFKSFRRRRMRNLLHRAIKRIR